jgi:hypothetical protein
VWFVGIEIHGKTQQLGSNTHNSRFEVIQMGYNATSRKEFVPYHMFHTLGVKLVPLKILNILSNVLAPTCNSGEVTVGNGHRIDVSIRNPVR